MKHKLNISPIIWGVVSGLLLFPAFIINLGLHPFLEDESIRATVALEMMLSGNYFTPTLHGDLYFAKPPLYNWLLIISYHLFGAINEWTTRLPTLFFLALFGIYIYQIHRRNDFTKVAAYSLVLLYLTCGRILFWDSFLGLIDICFSWVMYMMMCEMFMSAKQKRWRLFFLLAYFLATIGYLLKGFPAFVFLAITMAVCLYLQKAKKQLISWAHLSGILLTVILLGSFYYLYMQNGKIDQSISGLLDQSTRRTVFAKGIWKTIVHVFTYPFENIYHFLPWSLFCVFLLRKGMVEKLKQNDFVFFSALCFVANITVYWVSPEVYPRYILMLVPMAFTVFYFYYEGELQQPTWRLTALRYFYLGLILGLPILLGFALLNDKVNSVEGWQWKTAVLLLISTLVAIMYFFSKSPRLLILATMLLVMRIAFNTFVLPIRTQEDTALVAKKDAQRIAQKYGDKNLRLYQNSIIDNTSTFYLENNLGYIIGRADHSKSMIMDPMKYENPPVGYSVVDSFLIRRDERFLYLIEKNSK